jgi:putative ABC transport system permease protein
MFRYLPLILKNAWRNRRRTTLTILSVGVSMCLLGVLIAAYHALYLSDPPPEQALRLVTRNRVSLVFPMPQFYREKIRQISGVREVMANQWFGGVYKDQRDPKNFFARFAVEPDKIFSIYPEFRLPEEQKVAFQRERTACVVGRDLANKFNFQAGDRITLKGDIFPVTLELTVRGIFDSPRPSEVLFFNREYLEESVPPARRGTAGHFNILADTVDSVPRIAKAVDDEFRNATVQTRTETEQAFALSFVSFLGNVKMFLLSVSAAVTFTILLVSANTMAMSVRERVREVGILKTLGFTPGGILGIILGEAGAIALAGGAIGCLLAALLCSLIRKGPAFIVQLKTLTIQPSVAVVCLAVAVCIGLASSLIPAWQASRTSIVEALRSTE